MATKTENYNEGTSKGFGGEYSENRQGGGTGQGSQQRRVDEPLGAQTYGSGSMGRSQDIGRQVGGYYRQAMSRIGSGGREEGRYGRDEGRWGSDNSGGFESLGSSRGSSGRSYGSEFGEGTNYGQTTYGNYGQGTTGGQWGQSQGYGSNQGFGGGSGSSRSQYGQQGSVGSGIGTGEFGRGSYGQGGYSQGSSGQGSYGQGSYGQGYQGMGSEGGQQWSDRSGWQSREGIGDRIGLGSSSQGRGSGQEGIGQRRGWQKEPLLAREVMTRSVKSVLKNQNLRDVAQIMKDENCGIVPVVGDNGRLIGVVTDRDLVVRGLVDDRTPSSMRVEELMSDDVECVTPEESIHDVISLMGRKQIRRVPVVDRDDRLLGIISMGDIANRADYDTELQEALERVSSKRSFWSRLFS